MGIMHKSPFHFTGSLVCMLVESEAMLFFFSKTDFVLSIVLSVLICYILPDESPCAFSIQGCTREAT